MKKVINVVLFSLTLICCCILASVVTTNLVNKKNSKVIYVSDDKAPYTTLWLRRKLYMALFISSQQ